MSAQLVKHSFERLPFARCLKDHEPVRALLLYLLLISIFYAPVVFTGKSLQPSLYQPHGVVEGWVSGGRRPVNSFNVDLATPSYYEWPINKLIGDIYKKGELPLWNPYQAAGTPLAAQYSTKAFFPYQILEDISPVWTWDFFILGRLLVAGFFTYLFLTTLGLCFPSAFLGGLFYMFSGTFVWFINLEQMANTAMMLPVVMYMVEFLATRRGPVWIAGSAVAFAMLLLAGQPEVALYVSTLAFLYFFFRAFNLNRFHFLKPALSFISSYLLGLALASLLILPFLELMAEGHHIHPLGGIMGRQIIQSWISIFAFLTPSVTELPTDPDIVKFTGLSLLVELEGTYYRFLPINGFWDALGGYTGILSVFLSFTAIFAVLGSRVKRWRGFLLFFLMIGLAVILKNVGVRPFHWLGYLPLFDQVWSLRWAGPVWTFAISAAGAIGLETVLGGGGGASGEKRSGGPLNHVLWKIGSYFDEKPYMAAVISFLILFGIYIIIPTISIAIIVAFREEFFSANIVPFVVPSMLGGVIVTVLVIVCGFLMVIYSMREKIGNYGIVALGALELWWAVPRGYDPMWISLKWVPFFIGLVAAYLFFKERWRGAFCGVLSFLATFLIFDNISPHGFPEREDPFRPVPYVEFLKNRAGVYRSIGAYGVLFPNFASSVGIMDLRYVNSLTPKTYHDYRNMYLYKDIIDEDPVTSLWFTGRPERCIDVSGRYNARVICEGFSGKVEDDIGERLPGYSLLGVKYIIVPKAHKLKGLPLVYDKEVMIYENPLALERAFVAYELEVAGSYEDAQKMTLSEGFDPRKTVVIEEKAPPGFSSGNGHSKATIKDYRTNRVVVEVDAKRKGILVLSDVYYPGWRVKVNGEARRVLRVNGLIRGVFVEKGKSEVEFTYLPGSFLIGSGISLCAVLVCGLLFLYKKPWTGFSLTGKKNKVL
jgi:hypothetical protein